MSEANGAPPAASANAPTREDESPRPSTFTLFVVSPSAGVSNNRITVPLTTASTTVNEVKAKIRDALPSRPSDGGQRLIYRGRMLGRETETMLEIFGQALLDDPAEAKIIHLVLRPPTSETAPPPVPGPHAATSTVYHNVAATPQHQLPNPAAPAHPHPQQTPLSAMHALHQNMLHGMQAQQPLPGANTIPHQMLHQAEIMQNVMAQRLQALRVQTHRLHQEMGALEQRIQNPGAQAGVIGGQSATVSPSGFFTPPNEAQPAVHGNPTVQTLIDQQQRHRAAAGLQGLHHGSAAPASGRVSPNPNQPPQTTSYTREGVGPNGERWQVTVNETTRIIPIAQQQGLHGLSLRPDREPNAALDLQAVLRNADRFARHDMQRSASNPLARTASSISAPGITRPGTPGSNATPTTTNSSPSASTPLNPLNPPLPIPNPNSTSNQQNTNSDPLVYILSSPSGPRALLVSSTDTFYTPRQSRRHRGIVADGTQPVGLPEYRNRHHPAPQQFGAGNPPAPDRDGAGRLVERMQQRNVQIAQQLGQQPIPAPHGNPPAGPAAAQLGPILWLIVRLAGFVWFFTSGNASWSRWLMVSALAFVVFIINTGWLNGAADQILGPIRRHLETLIPLAGPDAALVPAANANAVPRHTPHPPGDGPNDPNWDGLTRAAPRRPGDPDPVEAAERLLEERRQANGGWLMAQIRRIEHSFLLFVASLVPGVGERHIAAREAEANAAEAERQRLIEAADNARGNPARDTQEREEREGQAAEGADAEGGEQNPPEDGADNPQPEADGAAPRPLIEV